MDANDDHSTDLNPHGIRSTADLPPGTTTMTSPVQAATAAANIAAASAAVMYPPHSSTSPEFPIRLPAAGHLTPLPPHNAPPHDGVITQPTASSFSREPVVSATPFPENYSIPTRSPSNAPSPLTPEQQRFIQTQVETLYGEIHGAVNDAMDERTPIDDARTAALVKTELDHYMRHSMQSLITAEIRPALMAYVDQAVHRGLTEIRAEIADFRATLPAVIAQAVRDLPPKHEPQSTMVTPHAPPPPPARPQQVPMGRYPIDAHRHHATHPPPTYAPPPAAPTWDPRRQSAPAGNPDHPSSSNDSSRASSHSTHTTTVAPIGAPSRSDTVDDRMGNRNMPATPPQYDLTTLATARTQRPYGPLSPYDPYGHTPHPAVSRHVHPDLPAQHTIHTRFRHAVDYRHYLLVDRNPQVSNRQMRKVAKTAREMGLMMKRHNFDAAKPVSIFGYLTQFRDTCDKQGINEGFATWLFPHFIKGRDADALQRLLTPSAIHHHHGAQERLSSYPEVVHYLLRTYATDENISAEIETLNTFTQGQLTEIAYADALRDRAMSCGNVYSNDDLLGMYVAGLHASIRGSARQFYTDHPSTTLAQLANHARNTADIQRRSFPSHSHRAPQAVMQVADDPNTTNLLSYQPRRPMRQRVTRETAHTPYGAPAQPRTPPAQESFTTTMASMDAAEYCRVCMLLTTAPDGHVTSQCPWVNSREFQETRVKNYNQFRLAFPGGARRRIPRPRRDTAPRRNGMPPRNLATSRQPFPSTRHAPDTRPTDDATATRTIQPPSPKNA